MKIFVRCSKCNKRFLLSDVRRPRNKYFCSRGCANSRTNSGPKRSLPLVKCRICGKEFYASCKRSAVNQKYCSRLCANRVRIVYNLDYIKKRIKIDPRTGCWIWQGIIDKKLGYGRIWAQSKDGMGACTHRVVYQLVHGKISDSLLVRHTCVNKACCNPDHLLSGTHLDNYHDSEESHKNGSAKNKGRHSANSIPIEIGNKRFPSMRSAAISEGISEHKIYSLVRQGKVKILQGPLV